MGAWETFKQYWNLDDDESPITDASSAQDSLIEDAILRFQGVSKEVTDKLAELSAARVGAGTGQELQRCKDAAILAYSYLNQGDLKNALKILERIVLNG